ncbi:MAG: hypothetical protein ABMB14_33100, partial [Myxococcota bacterium]
AAPPVMGGLMIGVVGCTFGAFVTDLFFARLGDWRAAVDDGLLGAISPLKTSGRPTASRDLANALRYVELPPLSPDRVATPATPGALKVSLRGGEITGPAFAGGDGENTGKIRIAGRTSDGADRLDGEITGRIRLPIAKIAPLPDRSSERDDPPDDE